MNLNSILALLFSFFLMSCALEPDKSKNQNLSLVGQWQLTEALISSGGTAEWSRVENGTTYQFYEEGNFTSNQFSDCSEGNYKFESGELKLNYTCEGFKTSFEKEEGWVTYKVELKVDYLLLIPTSIICAEECSYKFVKISK